ncbi:hypothetical protein SYJ56_21660 [Algoriphagus sp. D3-2-R+10]|uniref:hypothetical protein n=1 Tax=Algoriphagus aurantiacus TaxID=3103948 RepID=UPI002B39AF20|nr:hypothetical protein [Algoriphagus sp. D3-2-R+10]MEB2777936.1 hypothetical protein [Algoriphagus sp. D3-2-R+10]
MIQFEPLISWTWAWLFVGAIIVIFCFQLLWILKSNHKAWRKAVKISLNVLFALVLITYMFQPIWISNRPAEAVLVHSAAITKDKLRYWKDSLEIKKSVAITDYKSLGNPIYLLGSDFTQRDLLKFTAKDVRWIVDIEYGSIIFLDWKGMLREGELQAVNGRIETSDSLRIILTQQGETLAETIADPSSGTFSLRFPAKVVGRNELSLMVNDSLVGHVNFFAQAARPIQYSLQFAFPDAEIRMLRQFLINSGEQVNERIDISKNSIIRSGNSESDSLQFLIIDPEQLSKKSTQDAVDNGASVLVINLGEVGNDIPAINKAFGTNFKTKRITTQESREIEGGLEALSYAIENAIAQKSSFDQAFAMQQVGNGKIGVSLLGKTFPLKLGGDSLRYQEIWQEILGAMLPQESGSIEFQQPAFEGMQAEIQVNQVNFTEDFIIIDSDSVFLQPSLVNPFSRIGKFVNLDSGWVSVADSLEFYSYVADKWPSLRAKKLRADFLRSYSKKEIFSSDSVAKGKISDWVWLGLFLLILGMIWLEPKALK